MGPQRLELRAEQQRASHGTVIERLFPQAIANQRQRLVLPIEQRKRKLPGEALHGPQQAMALDGRQHHFGIRRSPESHSLELEWPANVLKVVDLTIEDHDVTAARRYHGLMTLDGEIDDR